MTFYIDRRTGEEFLRTCRETLHIKPSNLIELFMRAINNQVRGMDPIQPLIQDLVDYYLPKVTPGRPKKGT